MMFLYFTLLAFSGIPYELRTVAAMTLRTTLWAGIAWVTSHQAVRGERTG